MAYVTNREHFIPFNIADINSQPVLGLTLSSFVVTFLKDLIPATETVTVTEMGNGFYIASYTPVEPGFFFLELSHVPTGIKIEDSQEIDSVDSVNSGSSVSSLTQTMNGSNYTPAVINPSQYILKVYLASDWSIGNTSDSYVRAKTGLDQQGHWLNTPLYVVPGIYTFVAANEVTGATIAFVTNLQV